MGVGDNELNARSVYVFRCGESGVYAFTVDRTGQILPRIYPRIRWRLQREVTLQRDENETVKATLDAIRKCGFCLACAGVKSLGLLRQLET
jgi:hypothetical protein